jgi:LPPG:FO 2-phospho-L-lactate transferase
MSGRPKRVVALSGGIGGAKLALGLARVMAPENLTIIANTGDDFEHFGLTVSPDIDTLIYTLAGIANPETGWGRNDETWSFMAAMRQLGGPDWFSLGDGDLAMHVMRTHRLAGGGRLTDITRDIARALGVACDILPMADTPVRTFVETAQGRLAFQDYFVRLKCAPVVARLTFDGADRAKLPAEVAQALSREDLRAVVICPSNPLISIDPILAVPGMRDALAGCAAPVVAVSPIIAGRAVKGPTAKMLDELGIGASAAAVAHHYAGLLDGFVAEPGDAAQLNAEDLACQITATQTLMVTLDDRERLARTVLAFADRLAAEIGMNIVPIKGASHA